MTGPGAGTATPDGTVLGFDFGMYRIGVAVGQGVTASASALTVLVARDGKPDWAELGHLIEQWRPEALVVGLPLTLEGEEQEMTRLARRFGRQLAGRYNLPVYHADERLTSVEAGRVLAERGRERQQGERLDDEAARLLLEGWLSGDGRLPGGDGTATN